MKRCAPGAVTAATEGGTGGREGMGASKNEEEATCQEQLLCICSFAFVFPFFMILLYSYMCIFLHLLSVCPFSKKERKGSHGWQEPPLPRPTPNTPKKTPCCVARATNTDFSRLHRDKEGFFQKGTRVRRV